MAIEVGADGVQRMVRGMLMKGPLVLRTLAAKPEDRKTQTRRGLTALLGFGPITDFKVSETPGYDFAFRDKRRLWHDLTEAQLLACCPYGRSAEGSESAGDTGLIRGKKKPRKGLIRVGGDRLYLRETGWEWEDQHFVYAASPLVLMVDHLGVRTFKSLPADDPFLKMTPKERREWGWRVLPGIHMPRWAARGIVEITEVRVQRVQDISVEDAIAEGVNGIFLEGFDWLTREFFSAAEFAAFDPVRKFRLLYAQINGEESWISNEWVWAITYRLVEEESLLHV